MNERNQFKSENSIKFHSTFSGDEDYYRYLADIKWCDNGYQCRKCGHIKYCKCVKPFQEDVRNANMMKVPQQEPCSTSVNFPYNWLFTSHSR